jgi:hypothetical protein
VTIQNPATNISLEFFHFIFNPEQRRVFQLVEDKNDIELGDLMISIFFVANDLSRCNRLNSRRREKHNNGSISFSFYYVSCRLVAFSSLLIYSYTPITCKQADESFWYRPVLTESFPYLTQLRGWQNTAGGSVPHVPCIIPVLFSRGNMSSYYWSHILCLKYNHGFSRLILCIIIMLYCVLRSVWP